jgi:hypothetical protein
MTIHQIDLESEYNRLQDQIDSLKPMNGVAKPAIVALEIQLTNTVILAAALKAMNDLIRVIHSIDNYNRGL